MIFNKHYWLQQERGGYMARVFITRIPFNELFYSQVIVLTTKLQFCPTVITMTRHIVSVCSHIVSS